MPVVEFKDDEIKKMTRYAKKGKDFHFIYKERPKIKNAAIISQYVLAWGFLKYFDFEIQNKNYIKRFKVAYQKRYPDQIKNANEMIEIIKKNDIFKLREHRKVFEWLLDFSKLKKLIDLIKLC